MFTESFRPPPPYLTVGQITAHLRSVLLRDDILQDIWVRGEASGVTLSRGAHLFFSLKDGDALIKAVAWSPLARRLHARLTDGQEVLAHGRVDLYPTQGVYQLYVDEVLPVGTGVAYLEFERVRSILAAEGLFEEARKRPLPPYPTRIGVVTSAYGAARRDIETVLAQRWPGAEILLAGALVQGERAPASLIAGLKLVIRGRVDVVILGRGGGDVESLACFNDEGLARQIAAMPMPVVTGIGHETDFTIADFVADLRAPTPSAAAMAVAPDCQEVAAALGVLERALGQAAREMVRGRQLEARQQARLLLRSSPTYIISTRLQGLDGAASRLLRANERLGTERRANLRATATRVRAQAPRADRRREQLAWAESRLSQSARQWLLTKQGRLEQSAATLAALDPIQTLRRGYSVVFAEDLGGPVVSDAAQLSPGDRIAIRFRHGAASGRIENTSPDHTDKE